MSKYDLSIIIPARNEMFLARTIKDLLEHSEPSTEVIAVLDGAWADPSVLQNPRVTIIHHAKSIGQRAACNEAVRISRAKYVAKADAHCSFAQGFDRILLEDMQDDWTIVPTMRNLWAFDWKCMKCGKRTYQGPTPKSCPDCDNTTNFQRKMVWIAKDRPQSNSYCFDSEPHFQYFKDYSKRPEGQGDLTESMSLQGSFFMLTRKKWLELNICDEAFGSWGSQGIEVAAKTWLTGGRVVVNHRTYYGHMFRTQGGDFGFPYSLSGKAVDEAKKKMRDMLYNNMIQGQVRPLSWLLKKFWPVPGWNSIPEDGDTWQ